MTDNDVEFVATEQQIATTGRFGNISAYLKNISFPKLFKMHKFINVLKMLRTFYFHIGRSDEIGCPAPNTNDYLNLRVYPVEQTIEEGNIKSLNKRFYNN